jgi:signal transduction histidine kinase
MPLHVRPPFRAPRAAFLGLLLLLTLGVASVLAWQAYQSARSHEQVANGVLHDYVDTACWEFARRANTALDTAIAVPVKPLIHEAEAELARLLPQPAHPAPALSDLIPEPPPPPAGPGHPILGTFRLDMDSGEVLASTLDLPAEVQARLLDAGRTHARTLFLRYSEPGIVFIGAPSERRSEQQCQQVVGFEAASSWFAETLAPIVAHDPLLPASLTRGASNDSMLSLYVAEPMAHGAVYQSSGVMSDFKVWHPLDRRFGGLVAVAFLRPEAATSLVVGGLPRSRLPLLGGLLALTALLIVAALLQLRREYELSRLRTEFVSCVSHELRTPLAEIRLFGETLLLGRVRSDEERQRALEIIDQEARRLTQLVENVLLFSRSERRVSQVVLEPTVVAPVVRDVVEAFMPLARARHVQVRVDVDDDRVVAPLDRRALQQVLLNLLDNAVKYGPDGQTVTVVMTHSAGLVRIEVHDQGPGIPRGDRERIWEPFCRSSRERASGVAGTGIGLAVVRELCRLHGGSAWLDRPDLAGARFVVELPGASVVAAQAAPAAVET